MGQEIMLLVTTDEHGKAIIHSKELMHEFFLQNKSTSFLMNLKVIKDKGTDKQRAFYWAAIVPKFRFALLEAGYQLTANEVHEYLKYNCPFMRKQVTVNDPNGIRFIEVMKSVSDLSRKEFAEYIEWLGQYGAEKFSLQID